MAQKVASSPLGGFVGTIQPADDDLARCVHCGLCLNFCPTYRATGLETESPRGRIYLMRQVKDGRIDINDAFHQHMDLCLVCRACETACPSGVPFGRMMEATRVQLWNKPVGPLRERFMRRLMFEQIFPHRRRFRMAFRLLQLYERSGARALLQRSGLLSLLPEELRRQEALLPPLDEPFFDVQRQSPPHRAGTPRVGFVAGCVMSTAFGDVQRASVRVLERLGCQVIVPPGQGCCGALNVHAGEHRLAKRLAKRLIESMLHADVDAIIINSAGCGSVMKEYYLLFSNEPSFLPTVEAFEAKVRDFSEYIAGLETANRLGENTATNGHKIRAVYQDACHLRHAQGVIRQPRDLLSRLSGLELVELTYPDQCCGSAGVYNLEHPAMSEEVLRKKIEDIRSTGASLVISGNPGCILQLRKGAKEAGLDVRVEHIATVLDQALWQTGASA